MVPIRTLAAWLLMLACAHGCRAVPEPDVAPNDSSRVPTSDVQSTAADGTALRDTGSVPSTRPDSADDAQPAAKPDVSPNVAAPRDTSLENDVRAEIARRLEVLDREEGWAISGDDEDEIAAVGACVRPTREQRNGVKARVLSWLAKKLGWRLVVMDAAFFRFGCFGANGAQFVAVSGDSQLAGLAMPQHDAGPSDDGEIEDTTFGYLLRVTDHSIHDLAIDGHAWLLFDVDRDGTQEALLESRDRTLRRAVSRRAAHVRGRRPTAEGGRPAGRADEDPGVRGLDLSACRERDRAVGCV